MKLFPSFSLEKMLIENATNIYRNHLILFSTESCRKRSLPWFVRGGRLPRLSWWPLSEAPWVRWFFASCWLCVPPRCARRLFGWSCEPGRRWRRLCPWIDWFLRCRFIPPRWSGWFLRSCGWLRPCVPRFFGCAFWIPPWRRALRIPPRSGRRLLGSCCGRWSPPCCWFRCWTPPSTGLLLSWRMWWWWWQIRESWRRWWWPIEWRFNRCRVRRFILQKFNVISDGLHDSRQITFSQSCHLSCCCAGLIRCRLHRCSVGGHILPQIPLRRRWYLYN